MRAAEHVLHDRDAQLLRDVQPHRRELDRDVRVELLLVNAIEDREILGRRRARLALVRHAFAEQIERRRDALGVERANRLERVVERFTGDEAAGEFLGEPVVAHEPEDARLIREVEQRGAKHQSRTACEWSVAGLVMRMIGKSA